MVELFMRLAPVQFIHQGRFDSKVRIGFCR